MCALVGPNAAGKSTLLRLLMGHHTPWSGQVCLDGTPLRRRATCTRAHLISYVPQQGSVAFAFTVEEMVRMGIHAGGGYLSSAARAMSMCEVEALHDRVFQHLSTGQQQRVVLARAIAQSSAHGRFMLLDEPVSAMDVAHAHRTMALLRTLAAKGLGVLAVLHDIDLAARYADDVWLMAGGELTASGPWDEVLTTDNLEPVYGVHLERIASGSGRRPMFYVQPPGTMA